MAGLSGLSILAAVLALRVHTLVVVIAATLVTPMAANFNLVPALLLDLPGSRPVIRAQAPFAAAIWLFATGLMIVLTALT